MTDKNQSSPLTPEQLKQIKLEGIFQPHNRRKRNAIYNDDENKKVKFVHYTSGEAARYIIRSKRMWMHNTQCMDDYSEVQHGFEILKSFFDNSSNINNFSDMLNIYFPNIVNEAIEDFNQRWIYIRDNTYILSLSEHDEEENLHGRLSMWRAFGNSPARVAIVFDIPFYTTATSALKLMFNPVSYLSEEKFHIKLHQVIQNIQNNYAFLCSVNRLDILQHLFILLLTGVTCLKHEGFLEEREWRAIYSPEIASSILMEHETEVVGGVPQIVYKLPLDVTVSPELADLDISQLIHRVIIGPTSYPVPIYQAFVEELTNAGVENAHDKVHISGIPLRA